MSNLDRMQQPDALSRIGGAAQGGSAKPAGERAETDRENRDQQDAPPAGAGQPLRPGPADGQAGDKRTNWEGTDKQPPV